MEENLNFTVKGLFDEENRDRRRWQNPEEILKEAGLNPRDVFVDVGCGVGFFTVPAARIVGNSGEVYGIDVNEEAIELLKERARREGLRMVLRVGLAEEVTFCDHCADMVFFGIVLHDFKDPIRVLSNAKKMLKLSGRLVDVDWKKEPTVIGPPVHRRFSENDAESRMIRAGFKIKSIEDSGPYNYLIVAEPKAD